MVIVARKKAPPLGQNMWNDSMPPSYLYKSSGFLPMGIRNILYRLLAKLALLVTGTMAMVGCWNIKLCGVLGFNIEVSVNTTLSDYENV